MILLRIITRGLYDPAAGIPPDAWEARAESGDLLVARTRQPFFDGARALLVAGYDPAAFVTMRVAGKSHDSFKPVCLSTAARMEVREGNISARFRKWSPAPKRPLNRGDFADLPAFSASQVFGVVPDATAVSKDILAGHAVLPPEAA